MSYFEEWESITAKTFELIRKNRELLQYLCNSSKEPLDSPPPDWDKIFMNYVFPVPKDPLAKESQKAFINVYIKSTYPYDDNPFFRVDYLTIEVACHLEIWSLNDGGIRPYRICHLIDEMLNYKNSPSMSIQKPINYGTAVIKFGDMYYGYKMTYRMSNSSISGCGNTKQELNGET